MQHFQAKDDDYDVVDVDVVWTAEFAAKSWLTPLTGNMKLDTSKLLPSTVKTATYNDTLYAAPQTSDGALLYYRKDLVKTPADHVGGDDGGLLRSRRTPASAATPASSRSTRA